VRGLRASLFLHESKSGQEDKKDEQGNEDDWVLRYSFDKHEHHDNEAKRYKQKAFAFHHEVLSLEDNRCLLLTSSRRGCSNRFR